MTDRRSHCAIAIVLSTIAFATALALRTRSDPFLTTAAAAILGIALSSWALGRVRLAKLFAISPRGALIAIALGVVLVAVTHLAYHVVSPMLGHEIRGLYASIDNNIASPVLVAITAGVVVAEELIWRGAALELLAPHRRPAAGVLAVALYAVPQLTSNWILLLAAIGLGSLFTAQRLVTGRLTDPLLTHAVWSVSIFVIAPLT